MRGERDENGGVTAPGPLDLRLVDAVDRLSRALRIARQDIATKHGLSLLQLQLLEHLAPRHIKRVGELARDFGVTQPTASDALTALEGKGYVERGSDPTDRRATTVTLTATGARLASQISEEFAPIVEAERTTSADERGTALHVVLSEIRRLQNLGIITVDRSCFSCHHFQPPEPGREGHAYCTLLRETLRQQDLRVDCPEHSTLTGSAPR